MNTTVKLTSSDYRKIKGRNKRKHTILAHKRLMHIAGYDHCPALRIKESDAGQTYLTYHRYGKLNPYLKKLRNHKVRHSKCGSGNNYRHCESYWHLLER